MLSLANEALDLVGASSLASLTEGSPEANLVARILQPTTDRVLRTYPWNCAQARAVLTPLATAPAWGFDFAYALPQSPDYCLRVLSAGAEDAVWRLETQAGQPVILTDVGPALPILFTKRLTRAEEFDPLLADVLTAELAVRLSAKLTESRSRMQHLSQLAQERWQRAVQADAREQGRAHYTDSASWLGGRG